MAMKATAFCLPRDDVEELAAGVRDAAGGELFCSSSLLRDLAAPLATLRPPLPPEVAAKLASLSPRQLEAVQLAGSLKSDKEIAREMRIKVGTVKSHLDAAALRIGARSRAELYCLLHPAPRPADRVAA